MGPLKRCSARLHGPLCYPIGNHKVSLGSALQMMSPSNHIFYEPALLRTKLDSDGYLYLKNMISKDIVTEARMDLVRQMSKNDWFAPHTEEQLLEGAVEVQLSEKTKPIEVSRVVKECIKGTQVQAVVAQVLGGPSMPYDLETLEIGLPGETPQGFHCDSVYMGHGTKLVLSCWIPLMNITLGHGGLCCVRGSNHADSFTKIRETYGSYDIPSGDIRGDGALTSDASEILQGGLPLVSSSFTAGDVVLFTCYTMHSHLQNLTSRPRLSADIKWIMDEDVPDPRWMGSGDGMMTWRRTRQDSEKFPRTMDNAKQQWGIGRASANSGGGHAPPNEGA